jgi:hypothetical protein
VAVFTVAVFTLEAARGDGADFAATDGIDESAPPWVSLAAAANGEAGVEVRTGVRGVEVFSGLDAVGDDAAVAAIRVSGDVALAAPSAFGDVSVWRPCLPVLRALAAAGALCVPRSWLVDGAEAPVSAAAIGAAPSRAAPSPTVVAPVLSHAETANA